MSDPAPSSADPAPWPLTAFAAWLLPGLGHYLMGYRRRGLILGITLISLFTLGIFVGGIGVVDREHNRLWFAGQALIGPVAPLVDLYRQALDAQLAHQLEEHAEHLVHTTGHRLDSDRVLLDFLANGDEPPAYRRSLGRVHELGTLYCTLAGVLNLLVILDVIGRSSSAPIHPAPSPRDQPDRFARRSTTKEEGQP